MDLVSSGKALYVSLDNIWFAKNSLLDLVETFTKNGGKILYLDEVHRYEDWPIYIKNIYDMLSPLSRQKIWKLTNLSSDGICNWSISTNQSILVCLVRSYIIQTLMNPFTVEEFHEFSKTFS